LIPAGIHARHPYDHAVHLRRALLLFAIVLGLAALATSVSGPRDEAERARGQAGGQRTPRLEPQPQGGQAGSALRFDASRPTTRRLAAGSATTVVVGVHEPGLVEITRLGMSAAATPLTPAHFEVLERETGRYPIVFTPADGDESRPAGTLAVISPEERARAGSDDLPAQEQDR
jgi:hypothetical protein